MTDVLIVVLLAHVNVVLIIAFAHVARWLYEIHANLIHRIFERLLR